MLDFNLIVYAFVTRWGEEVNIAFGSRMLLDREQSFLGFCYRSGQGFFLSIQPQQFDRE
jgi:hypothetical protein